MSNPEKYDLIIVGGGIVGFSLANCLAASDLTIAVIEAREPELNWPADSLGIRVSAIGRAAQHVFSKHHVWQKITELGVSPYQNMHVWDSQGDGELSFNCQDIGEPNLGHIIENRVMVKALYERLQQFNNIKVICPSSCGKIITQENTVELTLDDGRILQANLLVGADGARSFVREHLNFELRERSYQQCAVVATVKTEQPHEKTAWQRFLPTGPLAFLPLIDPHASSIVWSTTPEQADYLLHQEIPDLNHQLESAFANRLGACEIISKPAAFPLTRRHVKNYVKPRVALIGDAAHTIHPLAGQGVNLGILDAESLAEMIISAQQKQRDIGDMSVLRRYERSRKSHTVAMLAAMDGIKVLFSNDYSLPARLRNQGLNLVNRSAKAKDFFIKRALGYFRT